MNANKSGLIAYAHVCRTDCSCAHPGELRCVVSIKGSMLLGVGETYTEAFKSMGEGWAVWYGN